MKNHILLALQFGRVEQAVGQNVGQNVECKAAILAQHPRIEGCAFDPGGGVEIAACALDRFRYGARVTPPRALEGHMFEEM